MVQKLDSEHKIKSGFVTIIGKPNVGKSTLINRFIGEKITIISKHPQTTRNKISAILTDDSYQIIFLDTPGIHKPRNILGEYMVKETKNALEEADIVIVMFDASRRLDEEDTAIIKLTSSIKKQKILTLNKIDLVKKSKLLILLDQISKLERFQEYIPISALKGDNTDILLNKTLSYLPEGPQYYPRDHLTDKSQRFHIAELIREKILENTWKEVPHSVAVKVDEFREIENKNMVFIKAIIYVERQTQKGILIGEKGNMLKKIGTEARIDIEKFLNKKIYLELWVKVYEKWRKNISALKRLEYI